MSKYFRFFENVRKSRNFNFLFCIMYKQYNSYFVFFGKFINFVFWGILYFWIFYIYTCRSLTRVGLLLVYLSLSLSDKPFRACHQGPTLCIHRCSQCLMQSALCGIWSTHASCCRTASGADTRIPRPETNITIPKVTTKSTPQTASPTCPATH